MDKQENETQFPIESEFNKLNISDNDSNPINANHKNCSYCNKPFIEKLWCKECDPYDIIEGWTSGNPDIDKFIKDTMYNARYHNYKYFLEWVPFDRFTDINQIGEGGFAKVYSAIWMDGKANYKYDYGSWKKLDPKPMKVTLKRLYESQNMSIEYLNELKIHWDVYLKENSLLDFYGITNDPKTKEFMLITKFAGYGSLRNILLSYFHNILWENKIRILGHLTLSLKNTHKLGYFHKNLHSGNITIFQAYSYMNPYFATIISEYRCVNSYISDFGLSGPANKQKSDNKIYGILPYIAPEVLNGEPYTKSSDIYSFGVIMAELSSGNPPFHDRNHDLSLALDICNGFRPEFGKGTPEIYKSLAYKCMNANPTQRPKADELNKILLFWYHSICGGILSYKGRKIRYAFQMADEEMQNIPIPFEEGFNSMYTSKVFTFNNLPKPVNSSAINTYLKEDMDINKDLSSCSYCNKLFITEELWCNECDPHGIIEGWTSGNLDIDKFIKDTMHLRRYNERNRLMFLEWIPFDRFTDVKQIGKGGFSEVYSATWIDYFEKKHDPMKNSLEMAPGERIIKLDCGSMKMALKRLNGSQNMSADYLNKLKTHWNILLEDKYGLLKSYGLTRDPKTKEFMIVLPFVNGGSLREILSNNFNTLSTFDKFGTLSQSIFQLAKLHNLGYSHKNFHSGNILGITTDVSATFISDFGLSGPAKSDNKIYGVLPYIAPEVLNGEAYTKSSDIYSFGIIMTEISSGKPPFFDRKHDANLALAICNGSRPEFGEGTPELYKKVACSCMNANPNQRPTADTLFDMLNTWSISLLKVIASKQSRKGLFFEGGKEISTSYDKDPDAIYISRAFTFNNLSKPVNSSFIKAYLVEEEDDNDVGDEH